VHGARSTEVIQAALFPGGGGVSPWPTGALGDCDNVRLSTEAGDVLVAGSRDFGLTGFDLYVPAQRREETERRLIAAGARRASVELAEVLRVEAGRPEFHVDMDEDTIPLEAGIEDRAISLTKGCYVGQEVIVRVLHRGHGRVARKLVGLVGEGVAAGESFERGDPIHADREVGRVTSAVWSPALARPLALGYVHRDFEAAGTRVSIGSGDGAKTAVVTHFPLARPDAASGV
jgi:folate-binding protein YgfZ